jgi:hypothetical protein
LEKDSGNLAFLVSFWDEGEGSPWQPFYMGAKGWAAGQGRLAKAPPLFPKVVVVEVKERVVEEKREKEGGDGFWPASQALASIFLYLSPSTTS